MKCAGAMVSQGPSSPGWSNKSAFETDLALDESQKWIEVTFQYHDCAVCFLSLDVVVCVVYACEQQDVTGQKFQSSKFQTSLQDGVLLCK